MLVAALEVGQGVAVNHINIILRQLTEHLPIQHCPLQLLGLDLPQNLALQGPGLFKKLAPELALLQPIQLLQHLLGLHGPNQRTTIPVLEEMFHHPPDPVLAFDHVGCALLDL